MTKLQPAKFQMDTFGDELFDGFTSGEDWNGFACPYFTWEQAQRVAAAHRLLGLAADYRSAGDEFIFTLLVGGHEETERYGAVRVEELTLYPIGAGQWIWSEASSVAG